MSDIPPTPAAPAPQETVIEPIALPMQRYSVELTLEVEDIDFVAVSIRLQKLLTQLKNARVTSSSIMHLGEKKKL